MTIDHQQLTIHMTIRSFLIGLLAVFMAILGQIRWLDGRGGESALLYGLAIGGFVAVFRTMGAGWLVPPTDGHPSTTARNLLAAQGWRIGLGLLLVGLATAGAVLGLREFHLREPWTTAGWFYCGGSVAVMLLAVAVLTNYRLPALPHEEDAGSAERWSRFTVPALLSSILLVGLFFRLYRFDELPFGTWYDEAENGLQALRLLEDPNFRPIFANSTHAPAHYIYLIAGAFKLFGVSTESIRLVSVVMGLGTILGGYLCGRELFGRVAGLSAAFLLAVSRWDVNLSRIGMYNISTPLFALLTVGFFLRALRTRSLFDFGLAGLFLGLGLSFYAAFQLIALAMAIFGLLLLLLEPRILTRYWLGIMAALFTAGLVIAPVMQFAYDHPDIYFDRTQNTSLFADKEPAERWPALRENAQRHLLMFNRTGDPNGRHNLPGAPMLDPVTGALFVLALALALWRWRQPRWLLLPVWLGVALLGGILSLDFEAPQSLRAVGALPAAYLLAAGALHLLWLAWSREGGRYYPGFFGVIAMLLLLPVALYDGHFYFNVQARDFAVWNAFSTPESIAATRLSELDSGTEVHISALFHGHPTMRFLAPDAQPYGRLETDTRFPLPVPADRSLLFMIDADRRGQFEELRTLYPDATFVEHRSPYGGPVSVYEVALEPEDLRALQGVEGRYYPNGEWSGEPLLTRRDATISFDWHEETPLTPPFSVEWRGVLRVDTYGEHRLRLDAPGPAQLWLDEAPVLDAKTSPEALLLLAEGNHALRLRLSIPDAEQQGLVALRWQTPPKEAEQVVPAHALYSGPVMANGLLGRYYPNGAWRAPAALVRKDPQLDLYFHITPLSRPYTVEWTGKIAIPQSGRYAFGLQSIDESRLWIDGELVTETPGDNRYTEAGLELTEGLHDLRVRFADRTAHTNITLSWRPPWGALEPVPAAALFPPMEDFGQVDMPTVASLQNLATDQTPSPPALLTGGEFALGAEVMLTGLNAPRGVTAGLDDLIYVADTGNGAVVVVDPAGAVVDMIEGRDPEQPESTHFVEPFDLATDIDGSILVLDSQLGRIIRLAARGMERESLPIGPEYLDRARGLFVDPDGVIWVAHTPGQRVLAFSPDGERLQEFRVTVAADSQPVDVALTPDGAIWVSDAGAHQLLRYNGDGTLTDAQPLPRANSLEATHLAVDRDGRLVATEPEAGRVVRRDGTGAPDAFWQLGDFGGGPPKPIGVAADSAGRIWVADGGRGQLLRLEQGP